MRTFAVAAALAVSTACGRSDPAPAPAAAAAPAKATAAPAPPPPALANTTPTPAPVDPVAPDRLSALLPDVAGWTRRSSRSETVPVPAPYSRAEAHYSRGDDAVELVLADSGFQPLILAPISVFFGSGSSEKSGDTTRTAVTVDGSPGSESWTASSQRGEIVILVSQRFVVTATGRGVADLAPLRTVVRAVDFARLGALK
jgi:hypothetical protein